MFGQENFNASAGGLRRLNEDEFVFVGQDHVGVTAKPERSHLTTVSLEKLPVCVSALLEGVLARAGDCFMKKSRARLSVSNCAIQSIRSRNTLYRGTSIATRCSGTVVTTAFCPRAGRRGVDRHTADQVWHRLEFL